MAKDLNRKFTKEDMSMATEPTKQPVTREKKVRVTMRCLDRFKRLTLSKAKGGAKKDVERPEARSTGGSHRHEESGGSFLQG